MFKLRKHLSATLALIVAVILLLPDMIFTAFADESTSDLFNYDEVHDVAVLIEYEHNDISFTITSPSGQKIDKNTDTDNITVFAGSTSTTVFIGGAEAGQWTITYDKGSNDHLTVRNVIQNTDFWIGLGIGVVAGVFGYKLMSEREQQLMALQQPAAGAMTASGCAKWKARRAKR